MSTVESHCIICMAPVSWERQLAEAEAALAQLEAQLAAQSLRIEELQSLLQQLVDRRSMPWMEYGNKYGLPTGKLHSWPGSKDIAASLPTMLKANEEVAQ